jgi:hypothetical protein
MSRLPMSRVTDVQDRSGNKKLLTFHNPTNQDHARVTRTKEESETVFFWARQRERPADRDPVTAIYLTNHREVNKSPSATNRHFYSLAYFAQRATHSQRPHSWLASVTILASRQFHSQCIILKRLRTLL